MVHRRVGKASNGVMQGILSASATKLCCPLETYAAPDVDHGIVCTCHWTYVGYLEPVVGWIHSMNQVSLSVSAGAGDELVEVTARGNATSMRPNGWNPNPS